ncbi:MAG: glycosyltransferase family 39 protein [Minisyncoccota bacterium]
MNNTFVIKKKYFEWSTRIAARFTPERWVVILSTVLAILATMYSFYHGYIVSYGDSESHLNIAKRVIDGLTPGFAQLGGIWLPLPHLLLVPFVYFDFLWRTGLAGSIVSGIAFVISSLYIYKLAHLLTKKTGAAFIAALVFMLNPNILYLQSTPMTELPLIVFFVLSSYFFIRFLLDDTKLLMLIAAAGFGFCASLSRYDGWALVMMEAGVLLLYYLPFKFNFKKLQLPDGRVPLLIASGKQAFLERWHKLEGRTILFVTLAFFGVFLWLLWGYLILGDPLYFTHSQFSASSQQNSWLARGELPAYHNVLMAFLYYALTSMEIAGTLIAIAALIGLLWYGFRRENQHRWLILLVLLVPFFFNVLALFLGQSVIFLPGLTPASFQWTLFNVRYGTMMLPAVALFVAYLFARSRAFGRAIIAMILILQSALFFVGFTPVLALADGVSGLSSEIAKTPDAQGWFARHYDHGMLLTDDFARTISTIRTPVPMRDIIYVGTKPYWEESLVAPEKYARWIIIQKGDAVWTSIYENPTTNARLYKYFNKVYTSENILIFRRMDTATSTK